MPRAGSGFIAYLGRAADRKIERPAGLAYWLDDTPSALVTLGLAMQHLAIQSIYFILPVAVASDMTHDAGGITRFLCLSILAAAILQVLQLLTRGPIGAGYPIPGSFSTACLGAYALTAAFGGTFNGMAAMVVLTGLGAIILTFAMHRLRVLLPNEVAGVVVILIGVALIGVAAGQLGLHPGEVPRDRSSVIIVVLTIAVMVGVGLTKGRMAPFAVLVGAIVGSLASIALGEGEPNAAAVITARPWLAVPMPFLPDFGQVRTPLLAAYAMGLVAVQATSLGSLVVMQRASDAAWTRPDPVPLRRGLLANGVAIVAAGLMGGAAPGPGSAAVGLSIAAGVLARRIVWCGVGLLVVVALCPKLVAVFVLTPAPVKSAALLYVAGFLMGQGCQLLAARLLDSRRMAVAAAGLSAGILVAIAPQPFLTHLPALASAPSFGALIAFAVNLITWPLVAMSRAATLTLDMSAGRAASDWFAQLAGTWGLKRSTAAAAERALVELTELLIGRGTQALDLRASHFEDRIVVDLAWTGDALPDPVDAPSPEDLLGSSAQQERFVVWLATRAALRFTQRSTGRRHEARLYFED